MQSIGPLRLLVFLLLPLLNAAASAAPALREVRSHLYLVFSQTSSPGIYEQIRAAPHDLIVLGTQHGDPPLDRAQADPDGKKLILGYANLTLGAIWHNPSLFTNGMPPSWFGNQDPDWPGSYSVQYWDPRWLAELSARFDRLIADGYDGVLLDSASGDFAWMAGNPHGNPVRPAPSQDLGVLLRNLKAYVQAKGLARPFYIVPNDPIGVAQNYPAGLAAVDAIFTENLYFISTGVGGMNTSVTRPPETVAWVEATAGALYATLGIPIFGNDYPQPATDRALSLRSFLLHSKLGWIPSVVKAESMVDTIATGPHMFTAVPGNPSVRGSNGVVNYLSGGKANPAVLTGGDQGDYFIGGEGINTITGGAGDDVIYPHAQKAVLQQTVKFKLASMIVGNQSTPKVSVRVNGVQALAPTAITALHPGSTQDVVVQVPPGSTLSSLVLTVTDASYVDAQNFSNLQIRGLTYKGASIDLAHAVISNGGGGPGWAYSNAGTVSFPAAAFAAVPAYPQANASTVDGGGGFNTAIYLGRYADYTLAPQADGSLLLTATASAEGPDVLRNIQRVKFADDCMFDWLERAYPQYLAPAGGVSAPLAGTPYYYRYYAATGNYVATSAANDRLWLLGTATAGALLDVGAASGYASAAGCSP